MKLCLRCNQYFEDGIELCPTDSSTLEAVGDNPLIGALINDRYVVDSVIGKGSSGIVYKATRLLMGSEVAVKVLHSYLGAESGALERFVREASAASKLRHPHIINIWEHGVTDDGQPYFVMDYLEGMTLADLIKQKGFLHPVKAEPIIRQVCEALAEAHRQGIIHQDIKPENIVLQESKYAEEGQDFVKVLDFGISDIATPESAGKRARLAAGSPAYMSPEQCQGLPLDYCTDIYSLGIVVFEMLTGRRPFEAVEVMSLFRQHVEEPVPRLASVRPDLKFSSELETCISKALSKNPRKRHQSIRDFQKDIEDACKQMESTQVKTRTIESESITRFSVPPGDRLTDDGGLEGDAFSDEGSYDDKLSVPAAPTTRVWSAPGTASTNFAPSDQIGSAAASSTSTTQEASTQDRETTAPGDNAGYHEAVNRLLRSAKKASEAVMNTTPEPEPAADISKWAREVLTRAPEQVSPSASEQAPGNTPPGQPQEKLQENFAPPFPAMKEIPITKPEPVQPTPPGEKKQAGDPIKEVYSTSLPGRNPDKPPTSTSEPEVITWAQRVLNRSSGEIAIPDPDKQTAQVREPGKPVISHIEPPKPAASPTLAHTDAAPVQPQPTLPHTGVAPAQPQPTSPHAGVAPAQPQPTSPHTGADDSLPVQTPPLTKPAGPRGGPDLHSLMAAPLDFWKPKHAADASNQPVPEPAKPAKKELHSMAESSGMSGRGGIADAAERLLSVLKPGGKKKEEKQQLFVPESVPESVPETPLPNEAPADVAQIVRQIAVEKERTKLEPPEPPELGPVTLEPAAANAATVAHSFSVDETVNREPAAANPFAEEVDRLLDASILPVVKKDAHKNTPAKSNVTAWSPDDIKRFDEPVNKGAEPLNQFASAVDAVLNAAILPAKQEPPKPRTGNRPNTGEMGADIIDVFEQLPPKVPQASEKVIPEPGIKTPSVRTGEALRDVKQPDWSKTNIAGTVQSPAIVAGKTDLQPTAPMSAEAHADAKGVEVKARLADAINRLARGQTDNTPPAPVNPSISLDGLPSFSESVLKNASPASMAASSESSAGRRISPPEITENRAEQPVPLELRSASPQGPQPTLAGTARPGSGPTQPGADAMRKPQESLKDKVAKVPQDPIKSEPVKPVYEEKRFSEPINKTKERLTPLAEAVDQALDAALIKRPRVTRQDAVKPALSEAAMRALEAPFQAPPSEPDSRRSEMMNQMKDAMQLLPPELCEIPAELITTGVVPAFAEVPETQKPAPGTSGEPEKMTDAVSRLIEAAKRAPETSGSRPEALNKKIEAVKKKIEALKFAQAAESGPVASQSVVTGMPPESQSLSEQVNRLLEAAQKTPGSGAFPKYQQQPQPPAGPPYGDYPSAKAVRTQDNPKIPDIPRRDAATASSTGLTADPGSVSDSARQALKQPRLNPDAAQDYYSGFKSVDTKAAKQQERNRTDMIQGRQRMRQQQSRPGLLKLIFMFLLACSTVVAVAVSFKVIPSGPPQPVAQPSFDDLLKSGKVDQARGKLDKRLKNLTAADMEKVSANCMTLAKKYAEQQRYAEAITLLNKVPHKYSKYLQVKTCIRDYKKKLIEQVQAH